MVDDHGIHASDGAASPGPAIDWDVRFVAETGSTNADLLTLIDGVRAGEPLRHVALRTDHQTAGRGRLDRRWDAPPGSNLLVSLLVPEPPSPPQVAVQAIAVAALRAVDEFVPPGAASLKWPNDLLLDGRKLAGVLAQRHPAGAVVVGIGLNVGWAPDGAACLADVAPAGSVPSPERVLDGLLRHLDRLVEGDRIDATLVVDAVRERLTTLGMDVRLELPGDRHVVGRATALGDDGRLGVVVDGADGPGDGIVWFDVGDVVHLRPAAPRRDR